MSTKKVNRNEQKTNINNQVEKASQSVSILTSQQDSQVEINEFSSQKEIVAELSESSSENLSEKKSLRGAASPNYKRTKKEKVLISARIDKQMEDEINRICEKENMSKTDILTFALDYVLSSYKMRKLFLGRNSFIENVTR